MTYVPWVAYGFFVNKPILMAFYVTGNIFQQLMDLAHCQRSVS